MASNSNIYQHALSTIEYELDRASRDQAEFIQKLRHDDDVFEVMRWAENELRSVARVKAARTVHETLTTMKGTGEEKLRSTIEALTQRVINKARSPHNSTSPVSNLMERELASAEARLLEILIECEFHGEFASGI